MGKIWLEIAVVFILLVINGVFAMTEIAVVSSRKAKLRHLAGQGNGRAKLALELAESPNRFLATVQIGITLVGILAGAFGGATIAEGIDRALQPVPRLASHGKSIGLVIVVLVITYLSLVIGELLPKRIGLGHPEGVAMLMAKPMNLLSRLSGPAVNLLGLSTEALLRVFRIRDSEEPTVSDEEIKTLMQEGLRTGAFNRVESKIVHSALDLECWTVRDILTPRTKIVWLDRNDPHESIWHKIVVSGHSHFPVYDGSRDNAVGIISVKAIYANLAAGMPAKIPDLMVAPLFVPSTQTIPQLLETFRTQRIHIALAADEFGGIEGLVTLNDVMEAILGEFPSLEERLKPEARKRDDGTWLVDGLFPLERLGEILTEIDLSEDQADEVRTLSGFLMKQLGRIPIEGERIKSGVYTFEIVDMDRHRIDKVLVERCGGSDT